MLCQVPQFARAEVHLRFQLLLIFAGRRLGVGQPFCHLIKGKGQVIQFPNAAACHLHAYFATGEPARRSPHSAHGPYHAHYRAD